MRKSRAQQPRGCCAKGCTHCVLFFFHGFAILASSSR
ncbi:hypothetical protein FKN13_25365 [Vibrio sp. 2-2(9)]|nr:hypothetical protein [Vibrio sp. 2-2(7)]NNN90703.1 hypothetical protein [Vibrio sp. 2-2(9)]